MYFVVHCEVELQNESKLDELLTTRVKQFWLSQPGVKSFHVYADSLEAEFEIAEPTLTEGFAMFGDPVGHRRQRTMMIEVEDADSLLRAAKTEEREKLREEVLTYSFKVEDSIQRELL